MVVDQGPGVELVEQLLVPDAPRQADALVGQGGDALGVGVGVGGGAHDDQREDGVGAHVALDDDVDVVLRLEAGHEKVEAPGAQVHFAQALGARPGQRGAVGDEGGGRPELLGVVVGDALGVGDDGVGQAHGGGLGGPVVAPPRRPPLAAAPLQAVHVGGHRDPRRAQGGQEGRVGGVEDDGDVGVDAAQEVAHGQGRVGQRLQGAALEGRQLDHPHAQVARRQGRGGVGVARVDEDLVPARGQAPAHLLDGRLEAPVVSGHTPCAKHHNSQSRGVGRGHKQPPAWERRAKNGDSSGAILTR